jgi:hypothetical protein
METRYGRILFQTSGCSGLRGALENGETPRDKVEARAKRALSFSSPKETHWAVGMRCLTVG